MAEGKPVEVSFLSDEEKRAGYILVELGPRLKKIGGDPERTGIFHEFDVHHPYDSEAHVVDGRVAKVYETAGVRLAMAQGRLQQVTDRPETEITSVADATANISMNPLESFIKKDEENRSLRAQLRELRAQLAELQAGGSESQDEEATPEEKPAKSSKK